MSRRLTVAGALIVLAIGQAQARPPQRQPRAPYLLVDLATGRTIASASPAVIDTPLLPGSIVKLATLIAGLESRTVTASTRLLCARVVHTEGVHATCAHPDLARPLTTTEALAHSCNSFFATVAGRLPPGSLNRTFIHLGLPAMSVETPVVAAALGLGPPRMTPRALLEALVRAAGPARSASMRDETRTLLRAGLRAAAVDGTAAAFAKRGVSALAKTGTSPMPGGGYQGLVVALSPADHPVLGIVVVAAGGAGMDAADIAAAILADHRTRPSDAGRAPARDDGHTSRVVGPSVRIGVTREGQPPLVVTRPLEEYVSEVVAGEAAPRSAPAVLEALAITARTYVLANRGRHAAEGFDVCDLTHCQVTAPATAAAIAATRATARVQIWLDRRTPPVFYHAACGGRTEAARDAWPSARAPARWPHLVSIEEEACRAGPRWTSEIAERDLTRALKQSGWRGQVTRHLEVVAWTPSGRASRLKLEGLTPPEIDGQAFRLAVGRVLGWQHLKSTAFTVTRTAAGYRFTGTGSGHGVGLCLAGAAALAARGQTTAAILARYFPGTTTGTPDSANADAATRLRLVLPASVESERSVLARHIDRHVDALSRQLAVAAPATLTVRIHPTGESFRRETGHPWWVAGATQGARIDLAPLPALIERGILEATLRHEIVHVLVEGVLAGRPRWVREGVALHFAGERLVTDDVTCPSDGELSRAPSRSALRKAYARALACVDRALQTGTAWTDLR